MKKFLNKKTKRILVFFLCISLFSFCSCKEKQAEISGFAMDAPYSVKALFLNDEEKDKIKNIVSDCDKAFDAYDENSLISKLNREKTSNNKELFSIIEETKKYCDESFDITVRSVSKLWDFNSQEPKLPNKKDIANALESVGFDNIEINGDTITLLNQSEIELGAVAKGYCADKVFDSLKESESIIDMGGTVITSKKDGITVGIKAPYEDGLLCSVSLKYAQGISTSGSYERNFYFNDKFYHHILDPKTGYSVDNELVSVTVISDSAMKSDILSTKYFVKGLMCETDSDVGVIFVTKDKKIYTKGNIDLKDINNNYKLIGTK